jgi:hypothetical protein
MANFLSYLDENQAFQSLKQFQEQEKEDYKQQKEQGILGFVETSPLAAHLLYKGKELYQQGAKLVEKTQEAVGKVEEGAQKIGKAVQQGASKIESAVSDVKSAGEEAVTKGQVLVEGTAEKAQSLVGETAERISSRGSTMLSKAGNNMSRKMLQNEFERDPESENVSMEENRGLFTKVRSIFRSGETGAKDLSQGVDEASQMGRTALAEGAQLGKSALSEGAEIGSNVASKVATAGGEIASAGAEAGATIGAVASEAIPVVGELAGLAFGLYDIIHSFADKPHIYNVARPVFSAGI